MCGLIGIVARKQMGFQSRELDLFEQMLLIDTLRGKDSTGVMSAMKHSKEVAVIKTAMEPFLMYRSKQWNDFRMRAVSQGHFVMGHNRAATRGTINNDNAHPFVENNIILMHNGTLHSTDNLTKEKTEVDSHAIAHALATNTPEEVIPKINGAFALIWYDTETEKLYATRNDQRPLSLVVTDDFYFLASEPWMVVAPASRQNRKIDNVREVVPGELLEFGLDGKLEYKILPKPKAFTQPTGGADDSYGYGQWLRNQQKHNRHFSQWTDSNLTDDEEDTETPFDQGNLKELPEITNLRKALAQRAQKVDSQPSNVCALTLRPDKALMSQLKDKTSTNTTGSGQSTKNDGGTDGLTPLQVEEERLEGLQRSIIVNNEMFKKGTTQLVKIWEVNTTVNGRARWAGKIMTPNKEMIDCTGFLPDNILPAEWPLWIDTICHGIVAWATQSTCGPTIFIRDTQRCKYMDIHGTDVPAQIWDHAQKNCTCKQCGGVVEQWERLYTHIRATASILPGSTAPMNQVAMTCPECIMRVLPDGEIYDNFHKKYYTIKNAIYEGRRNKARADETRQALAAAQASSDCPLQDSEPVSGEPCGTHGSTIAVPGPQTLQ